MVIDFLSNFGMLFIIIVLISFITKLLKQPIILGYVFSGIFFTSLFSYIMPIFFPDKSFILAEITEISGYMFIFAQLGITFMLFLMGMEFDLKSLRYLGKDLFITTSIQSLIFFACGFLVSSFFGFSKIESIYVGIIIMFSSTLLIVKWVEDKKESKTLHGKIILGTTIVHDIFAIIAITILSLLQESSLSNIYLSPLKGIILILIAFLMAKYLLNPLFRFSSRSPELLFIFSMSICFIFVIIAPLLGYSSTIGAFIAGIIIASTIYSTEISTRLKPLIIFFNMLFFVGIGFQIDLSINPSLLLFIGALCLITFVLKPFITYLTLRIMGYDLKTSYLSGMYLSQNSEFGIIIIAAGISAGIIGNDLNSIGIIVIILSMIISSYFIKYAQKIFKRFEKQINFIDMLLFRIKNQKEFTFKDKDFEYNIIFFGYHDLSNEILDKFKKLSKSSVVIENDPEKIEILKKEGYNYIYNSVNNPQFFEHIPFEKVELIVSSLIDVDENKMIVKQLKIKNPKAVAIVAAKSLKDSIELYDNNADYVLFTSYLNNQQVSVLLEDYTSDITKIISKKQTEHDILKKIQRKRQEARKNIEIDYKNGFISLKKQVKKIVSKNKID
jgi:Kef-type K+ transport system membrane component KefB